MESTFMPNNLRIVFSTPVSSLNEVKLNTEKNKKHIYKDKYEWSVRLLEDETAYDFDLYKYVEMYEKDTGNSVNTLTKIYVLSNDNVVNIVHNNEESGWINVWKDLTNTLSSYSKCQGRKVASMIIDKDTHSIIATGINGTMPGKVNCDDRFKKILGEWYVITENGSYKKSEDPEVHHKWSLINEIHAEVNTITNLNKNSIQVTDNMIMIVTHCPCYDCAKLLTRSGIKHLIINNVYEPEEDGQVIQFLLENGIAVDYPE